MGPHLQKRLMPESWAWVTSPGPGLVIMTAGSYKVRPLSMLPPPFTWLNSPTYAAPL
jgi:hypothetical protein